MTKRTLLLAVAVLTAATAAFGQNRADRQSLSNENSFSMILLGDPQGYIKYDINQPLFELCTAWISDNIEQLNIKAVLCTGDLVEQDENIVMNRSMLNQTSREMWENVSRSFARLDGRVPYIISPGNHDYGYQKAENSKTHFPEYFPFERNRCWRDIILSSCPNRNGDITIENAAFKFNDPAWGEMIVICTEFQPRDEVLQWALDLCNKYKDSKVFFITHSLLLEKSAEYTKVGYKIRPANGGQDIWDKLLSKAPNIVLALCGHAGEPGKDGNDYSLNCAYRCDLNDSGRKVHQMMYNVQVLGGGWNGNGGDGWLRILEFCPDGKTVKVNTYSPLFGISNLTKHLAHLTDKDNRFDFTIE